MIKTEFAFTSSDGVHKIYGTIWAPDNKQRIKAIVQISHGKVEHIGRYENFAQFLTDNGYAVVGNDHLGHGRSVDNKEEHGCFTTEKSEETIVKDLYIVTCKAKEMFKNKPIFLVGHSMGSIIARKYITIYGNKIDGAAIIGTAVKSEITLKFARMVATMIGKLHGMNYKSKLFDKLSMGIDICKKKADPYDSWLTKDRKIVKNYYRDPYCQFMFSVNAYITLFKILSYAQDKKNIRRIPKGLPVLIASGKDDPVGGYGYSVEKTYEALKKAGIRDLTKKLYKNDRHEILNETDRQQVYEDILKWLNERIPYKLD